MPLASEAFNELIRLVELDYERSSKFVESLAGVSTTIRGWAVTLSLALTGFAIDHHAVALAVLGAITAIVFAVLDEYYGALYSKAFQRSVSLEEITALYFNMLTTGAADSSLKQRLDARLVGHAFGVFTHLRNVTWRDRIEAIRPSLVILYALLILIGIAAAIYVSVTPAPPVK